MPTASAADTIRILVATDNHVGFGERDAIRGEDSWRSFHEIMCLAKERDVDMVLLAGDLFHDNRPSRKAMFNVMRSLRMNCLGDKPCELELLSDNSEVFQGAFDYVNYEDPDINVAIPVFSIHGNHDDPSGEGHLAALDILQTAGLVNYYGRTPESDNIQIKPVLLQKGRTKLALYGMSNVRDERLFRTFRDGKVKFFRPGLHKGDWFNLMSVHQNRHAYTETGFLPENFLPDFMNLVVWGHEHECLIEPTYNADTNFHVMQPGSSVATSLVPGESGPKFVSILDVVGKDFKTEHIRLKSVRPFVMREIVLAQEKEAMKVAKKPNNQTDLTRFLEGLVHNMIQDANQEWKDAQGSESQDSDEKPPLPLIRLRVEYTAPDGGQFNCENPQRFSNRFVGKVANVNDVVQFHRKKSTVKKMNANGVDVPEVSNLAAQNIDAVRVDKLVREFLSAQSLTIFPQNSFGDAVSQYVDKDDKHAMEAFVVDSLKKQVQQLLTMEHEDEEGLQDAMEGAKARMEELFAQGHMADYKKSRRKPKPSGWDSDLEGHWYDQAAAFVRSGDEDEYAEDHDEDDALVATKAPSKNRSKSAAATAGRKGGTKKAPARTTRGKRTVADESDEEEEDVVMVEDSENGQEDSNPLFVKPKPASRSNKSAAAASSKAAPSKSRRAPTRAAAASMKQSQITFSQGGANGQRVEEISDPASSDDDDDDAFEPAASGRSLRRR